MESLKPGMVRTIYCRIKRLMFEQRAATLDRWVTVRLLVDEGFDQEEVEEAIALLHNPGGLFYEKSRGQIALVR